MTIKFIQHEEQNFFKSMKKGDRTCGTPSTVIAERKQRERIRGNIQINSVLKLLKFEKMQR